MKTQDDIVKYYRRLRADRSDIFGFTAEVLLRYLSADKAKEFCKPDADLSGWPLCPLTKEGILEEMRFYMEFAWGKVYDHRGISASRSIEKMQAWLWLLGDDEMVTFADDDENYPQYGAPILKAICEKYGFPIPDDTDTQNMAAGKPCIRGCQEGCGQGIW